MTLVEIKMMVPKEYAEQAKKYTLEAIEIMVREAAQKQVEVTISPVIEEMKSANIESVIQEEAKSEVTDILKTDE